MEQSKTCTTCKQIKPLDDFSNYKKSKDGKNYRCRSCTSHQFKEWAAKNKQYQYDRNLAWRTANVERNRETKNAWNRAHPEKARARTKQWIANNPDKKRELNRKWELANPEKVRAKERNWSAKNPQKIVAKNLRRNSRMVANGIYSITKREISQLLLKSCFYCNSNKNMTIDHVIPVSRNGKHSIGNLVPACKSCNSSKRDLTIMEWRLKEETPQSLRTLRGFQS